MTCVTFGAKFVHIVLNKNIVKQSRSQIFAFIVRFLYVSNLKSYRIQFCIQKATGENTKAMAFVTRRKYWALNFEALTEISVVSRMFWKNKCYDSKAVLLFHMGQ